METYLILRRGGWRTADEWQEAARRTATEAERMAEDIRWLRSYVLAEMSGELGTLCIYHASSPEAIRRHAYAATLPIDEIVAVADTLVVRPDSQPVAIRERRSRMNQQMLRIRRRAAATPAASSAEEEAAAQSHDGRGGR